MTSSISSSVRTGSARPWLAILGASCITGFVGCASSPERPAREPFASLLERRLSAAADEPGGTAVGTAEAMLRGVETRARSLPEMPRRHGELAAFVQGTRHEELAPGVREVLVLAPARPYPALVESARQEALSAYDAARQRIEEVEGARTRYGELERRARRSFDDLRAMEVAAAELEFLERWSEVWLDPRDAAYDVRRLQWDSFLGRLAPLDPNVLRLRVERLDPSQRDRGRAWLVVQLGTAADELLRASIASGPWLTPSVLELLERSGAGRPELRSLALRGRRQGIAQKHRGDPQAALLEMIETADPPIQSAAGFLEVVRVVAEQGPPAAEWTLAFHDSASAAVTVRHAFARSESPSASFALFFALVAVHGEARFPDRGRPFEDVLGALRSAPGERLARALAALEPWFDAGGRAALAGLAILEREGWRQGLADPLLERLVQGVDR